MLKLTNGCKKTEILQQTERKRLVLHLKDAKMNGHKALIKNNKLIIGGRTYGIQDLTETQLSHAGGASGSMGEQIATERSPEGDNLREQLRKITHIALGQGEDVVTGLIERTNLPAGSKLYFDHLFIFVNLLERLCRKSLGRTGTLSENRIGKIEEKTLEEKRKKAGRRRYKKRNTCILGKCLKSKSQPKSKVQASLVVEIPDLVIAARRRSEDHTVDLEDTCTSQACRIPTMADIKPGRDKSVATKCKNSFEILTLSLQEINDLKERIRGQGPTCGMSKNRSKVWRPI
ncbi:hypothetical protein ILUMI_19243 [Ignelater luminosus]|uniref:Transposase n=1 Tax=Ignelater luminosus TaxID=2038154 RepID=A0A8K0CNH3_IGNLU|nr:hypothetical protein ILUMI_19243 [Ignelater luminosus]